MLYKNKKCVPRLEKIGCYECDARPADLWQRFVSDSDIAQSCCKMRWKAALKRLVTQHIDIETRVVASCISRQSVLYHHMT